MVTNPTTAITSMAMNPASFPKAMEKPIKPTNDTPMAAAAKVRKTTAYAHELQRFLQAFENGITLLIHRHNSG